MKEEDVKVRSLGFILRVEECQDSISVSERSLWIDVRVQCRQEKWEALK